MHNQWQEKVIPVHSSGVPAEEYLPNPWKEFLPVLDWGCYLDKSLSASTEFLDLYLAESKFSPQMLSSQSNPDSFLWR